MPARKVYITVNAIFSPEGHVTPISFMWEDERQYEVDRVLDCQRVASLRAGGVGLRYTVMVRGKQTYMWLEDGDRWFMEGRE